MYGMHRTSKVLCSSIMNSRILFWRFCSAGDGMIEVYSFTASPTLIAINN